MARLYAGALLFQTLAQLSWLPELQQKKAASDSECE